MGPIKAVCNFSDLKRLEVINLTDGSRLGNICDIEADLCLGRVTAILVPGKGGWLDFFQKEKRQRRILWEQIERIGDDTILVHWEEEAR